MKKILLVCVTLCLAAFTYAQVTSNPPFVTSDYAEDFTVIFDATQGEGGMAGAKTCFAHTGVITTKSKNDTDWKNASKWGDNADKYKLKSIGNNLWELTITGGLKAYYGLKDTDVVTKLAFVFRTSDSKTQTENIYLDIYEAGTVNNTLSITPKGICDINQTVTINGLFSTQMESIQLLHGDVEIKAVTNTDKIEAEVQIVSAGMQDFYMIGKLKDETYNDTINIFSIANNYLPLPEDLQEGINYTGGNKVALVFRAPLSKSAHILGDFNNWEVSLDYQMNVDTAYFDGTAYKELTRIGKKKDSLAIGTIDTIYVGTLNKDFKIVGKDTLLQFTRDENNIVIDTTITVFPKDSVYTTLFWQEFEVPSATKKYAFQYLIDGELQVSDPYSEVVLDPWNDGSIVLDNTLPKYPAKGDGMVSILQANKRQYDWTVTDFQGPKKEDLLIYELHIRDFAQTKKLREVISKLDYLKDLGINAIELMPITEFDGNNSWGYDPNHCFAYDKAYGAESTYKEFIDKCHQRGIAVIIDMVFNHATGNCPFLKLYASGYEPTDENPWFNRIARHPYNVFSDFNHEYIGTRKYFKRVLQYWLEEYKVDGYRMDLTKGFTQTNSGNDVNKWAQYDASRIAILKDYYDVVKATKPDAYFILEHLSEYKEEEELANYGMLPWRNMNHGYNSLAKGTTSDISGMKENRWVSYAESHDEERNMYVAKKEGKGNLKTDKAARLARVPALIAFSQLIPGPKMMWQFGEMGYDYSINDCGDGKNGADGTIKEDCRVGEKPNPWKLKWDSDELRMKAYYESSKVINLRSQHPAFFTDKTVTLINANASIDKPRRLNIKYRPAANDPDAEEAIDIIVMANFSAEMEIMASGDFTQTGIWYNYMTGEQIQVKRTNKTITLQPGELIILTSRPVENKVAIEEVTNNENGCIIYPTITNDLITVVSATTPAYINVYSLSGNTVATAQDTDVISLANLTKGTYLVQVQVEDKVSVHKIIKQ